MEGGQRQSDSELSAGESLGVCWSLERLTLGWQWEGAVGSAQASLWGVRGSGNVCERLCEAATASYLWLKAFTFPAQKFPSTSFPWIPLPPFSEGNCPCPPFLPQ